MYSNWKERNKTIFTDDVLLYIENPKKSAKKFLELMKFSKVVGFEISMQKSIIFLYNKQSKNEIKKMFHL